MRSHLPAAPPVRSPGRRYVDFVALTYAKDVIVSLMGVPLGPASSGPIIGRTVKEW